MVSRQERQDAAAAVLQQELERVVDSGDYAAWFRRLARFHTYSAGNQALIVAQRPDATRVASFTAWKNLGRSVNKGERGILIWVPKPYWVDATGQRIPPPTDAAGRAGAVRKVTFGVGYVFDVTQTDGDPIDLGPDVTADAPDELVAHLDTYCADQGVTVDYRDTMPLGVSGYYQRERDRIVIAAAHSRGEQVATWAHELAHREDPALQAAQVRGERDYYTHNRPDCEAAAEAASHMIGALHGFDTTDAAAGYIAAWVRGDVDRLTALHERVCGIVDTICPPTPTTDAGVTVAAEPAATYDAVRVLGPLPTTISPAARANRHGLYPPSPAPAPMPAAGAAGGVT